MNETPVVVYSAANRAQAYLLMDWLREQGIDAQVVNDSLEAAGGELPLGWTSAPKLVTPDSQAAKARHLLTQYEARPAPQEEAAEPAASPSVAWPACPRCHARRPTLCPHCGTSGSEFPQAWLGRDGEDDLLVVCPTCDEPFRPEFYRTCHRCQYDFGDGLPPPDVQPRTAEREPLKVWLTLGGICLGLAVVVVYFIWLLGR
jgi:hypothetical protein